ncbi:MAG: hydroxymethylbilane synthase, partial [Nitrospinales bacterium]
RAFLKVLEGGCQVPIGDYAVIENEELLLKGLVASLDGKIIIQAEKKGNPQQAKNLGETLAKELLEKGAGKILKEIYE